MRYDRMCLRKDYMAKRQSMHFSKIIGTSVGADYAHEHIDRVIRIGDWTVMLSRSEASRRPERDPSLR
jgi:hypothetical protein